MRKQGCRDDPPRRYNLRASTRRSTRISVHWAKIVEAMRPYWYPNTLPFKNYLLDFRREMLGQDLSENNLLRMARESWRETPQEDRKFYIIAARQARLRLHRGKTNKNTEDIDEDDLDAEDHDGCAMDDVLSAASEPNDDSDRWEADVSATASEPSGEFDVDCTAANAPATTSERSGEFDVNCTVANPPATAGKLSGEFNVDCTMANPPATAGEPSGEFDVDCTATNPPATVGELSGEFNVDCTEANPPANAGEPIGEFNADCTAANVSAIASKPSKDFNQWETDFPRATDKQESTEDTDGPCLPEPANTSTYLQRRTLRNTKFPLHYGAYV